MARILVIDDSADIRDAVGLLLSRAGHRVSMASAGAEGLEMAEPGSFDLILLDVWMPGETGLEVLEKLQKKIPEVPVIVCSGGGPGRSLENAVAIAEARGAVHVLLKPFEDKELLDAISTYLQV